MKPMSQQHKKLVINYLENRLPDKNAETALHAIRKVFNAEAQKELGYFTENGAWIPITFRRVRYLLEVDSPNFPALVQWPDGRVVEVFCREIKY